jgi:alpha-L-fucosidase
VRHRYTRRRFLARTAGAAGAGLTAPLWAPRAAAAAPQVTTPARTIARGPFQPTWESLTAGYTCPEWFRDAKFGIWAHWTAQCVPEQGDWYARNMYLQGNPAYDYHVTTYGHPSTVGFMQLDHLWKAEHWDPDALMARYQRAGAKYFFALANHHDNFDTFDSKHHAWNAVNIGPRQDIVGTWARVARSRGLRFGVSNHSAHAWHWFQVAYGYDGEGPRAGVRYDAATLTKADGRGTWWDGLDPQDLYTGRNIVIPDGITSARAVMDWHRRNDGVWTEEPPPHNQAFVDRWFLRCQDLVDQYHPDVLYFDDTELPLGQAGLDAVAHYYYSSMARARGALDVVVTGKKMTPAHRPALVEDIERGVATGIRPDPWQTDTCIGSWHYSRAIAEQNKYKTVDQVVDMLLDIVSKNGNLMLSIPVRGDGTIDAHEIAFLDGMAAWMHVNGEGIFGSRPWRTYGEGPSTQAPPEAGQFGGARDVRSAPYTGEDVRFMTRGGALYAYLLAWPTAPRAVITSLATASPHLGGRRITDVRLLGYDGSLTWSQTGEGLVIRLPPQPPSDHAVGFRITGIL